MSDTKTERCPTCRSKCIVTGNTTKYFVPISTESLEKQLAERDAALARCVEALEERMALLVKLRKAVKPFRDIAVGTVGRIPTERLSASDWHTLWKAYALPPPSDVLASIYTSAQATADVLAAARETQEKYNELLYWVNNKHPNETRHETALRYIRQAEHPQNTGACEAIREEQEYRSSDNS